MKVIGIFAEFCYETTASYPSINDHLERLKQNGESVRRLMRLLLCLIFVTFILFDLQVAFVRPHRQSHLANHLYITYRITAITPQCDKHRKHRQLHKNQSDASVVNCSDFGWLLLDQYKWCERFLPLQTTLARFRFQVFERLQCLQSIKISMAQTSSESRKKTSLPITIKIERWSFCI